MEATDNPQLPPDLFDLAPAGITLTTLDGRFLHFNQAFAKMMGYYPEELRGLNAQAICDQDDGRYLLLEILRRGTQADNLQVRLRRKDGSSFDCLLISGPSGGGQGDQILTVFIDISERVRAEQTLRAEKAVADLIIETLPGVVFMLDRKGRFIRWNKYVEAHSNTPSSDIFLRLGLLAIDPADREMVAARLNEAFVLGGAQCEARLLTTSGPRYFSISGQRVDLGGELYIIGIAADIEDRRRKEEETRLDTARIRGLLRISQEASTREDELFNPALEEISRLSGSRYSLICRYDDTIGKMGVPFWSTQAAADCRVDSASKSAWLPETGIWTEAIRRRQAIILNDLGASPPLGRAFPRGHVEILRLMSVPVFRSGRLIALAAVANRNSDYTAQDARQLMLMMDSLCRLIEHRQAGAARGES